LFFYPCYPCNPWLNLFHSFLDQLADGLELRMTRAADPLEDAHFAGRQNGSRPFQPAQSNFVIDTVARTNGIDSDIHAEIQGQQIQGGVQHAHMRLNPA